MDKAQAGAAEAKEEVKLSDVLKPSTLIIAMVMIVLMILFGWYVFVLQPVLKDNESMVHFSAISKRDAAPETAPVTNVKANDTEKAQLQLGTKLTLPAELKADKTEARAERAVTDSSANTARHTEKRVTAEPEQRAEPRSWLRKIMQSGTEEHKCTQAEIALQQCR